MKTEKCRWHTQCCRFLFRSFRSSVFYMYAYSAASTCQERLQLIICQTKIVCVVVMLLFKIFLENCLVENFHILQRPVGILFIEQWSSHDHDS